MSTIPARAVAIAAALDDHDDLPFGSLTLWNDDTASIRMPYTYGPGFKSVRELTTWAQEFGTEVIISLSSYGGNGDVETTVDLGGEHVAVKTSIGTAQAYELGRILQRELNRDVSIHISAENLLAALDQAVTS